MFHALSRLLGFGPPPRLTNVHRREKRVQLRLEQLENRLVPATITVTTTADDPNVPFPNMTTLRDAIGQANASNDGSDTITFAANVTGSIQLQAALPALAKNITINGPGASVLEVLGSGGNAQNLYRVFSIQAGTICEIDNLGIGNGYADGGDGGGILNEGVLNLFNDEIVFNQADTGDGGGIYNAAGAKLLLYSTNVSQNTATRDGGGIDNEGQLQVWGGSQIDANSANFGGGLFNGPAAIMNVWSDSQIYNNQAYMGGGVYISGGTVSISGGGIEGNHAENRGGGIYVSAGSLTLTGGITIGPSNSATYGGGLYLGANSTTTFNGCTISGNQASTGVGYYEQIGATINPLAINNQDGFYRGT